MFVFVYLNMTWTFDTKKGIDEKSKTMGGGHSDWPPVGELPDSIYDQINCGHITMDDLEVGDKVKCYKGNQVPVNLGAHPTKGRVYALPPYTEDNYGRKRRINDGRFALWKGTGAHGDPITIPTRPDFVVEIVEKGTGHEIDHFNPEDDWRTN